MRSAPKNVPTISKTQDIELNLIPL
jgi:hypothetical protein